MREHRLYQADWLMRFYGFAPKEVAAATDEQGMLPLDIDPKLAWALKRRERFPVDINRARPSATARPRPRHQGGRPHPLVPPLAQAPARRVGRLTLSSQRCGLHRHQSTGGRPGWRPR